MEIKRPKIKSMKYEDFNDNEYLEQMVRELRENGTHVVAGCLDEVINWGRSNSLWPLTFATSCCGIEFMAVGAVRYAFRNVPEATLFNTSGIPASSFRTDDWEVK